MDGDGVRQGKLMRHTCGYPFRVRVIAPINDYIVIEYRDACHWSLPYYHCPHCAERLKLWWQMSAAEEIGGDLHE